MSVEEGVNVFRRALSYEGSQVVVSTTKSSNRIGQIELTPETSLSASPPEALAGNREKQPLKDQVLSIFRSVLGESISPDDDFLDHGGDSISAMHIIAKLNHISDSRVTYGQLFSARTVSALAEQLG